MQSYLSMTDYLWPEDCLYYYESILKTPPDELFGGFWLQVSSKKINGHFIEIWQRKNNETGEGEN